MENLFYIKKGSLCFIIPVFTENSKVCDKYLNKLAADLERINDEGFDKNERRKCRRNTIKRSKHEFITDQRIRRYFPNIQTKFQPSECTETYEGRFLCRCCASAIKFHDDGIQKKNTLQFHLDSFNIKYYHKKDGNNEGTSSIENAFECSFNMNVILYLMHEGDEKIAYLLFEINMEDISGGIINDNSTSIQYVRSEQIIFIKHLFVNTLHVLKSRLSKRMLHKTLPPQVFAKQKTQLLSEMKNALLFQYSIYLLSSVSIVCF